MAKIRIGEIDALLAAPTISAEDKASLISEKAELINSNHNLKVSHLSFPTPSPTRNGFGYYGHVIERINANNVG